MGFAHFLIEIGIWVAIAIDHPDSTSLAAKSELSKLYSPGCRGNPPVVAHPLKAPDVLARPELCSNSVFPLLKQCLQLCKWNVLKYGKELQDWIADFRLTQKKMSTQWQK